MARNSIIAMTDAGCVARKNWLKNITDPFNNKEVDVVAGFYNMTGKSALQKARTSARTSSQRKIWETCNPG